MILSVYTEAFKILRMGGALLNADLIPKGGIKDPGKLYPEEHRLYLEKVGFQNVKKAKTIGRAVCMIGRKV